MELAYHTLKTYFYQHRNFYWRALGLGGRQMNQKTVPWPAGTGPVAVRHLLSSPSQAWLKQSCFFFFFFLPWFFPAAWPEVCLQLSSTTQGWRTALVGTCLELTRSQRSWEQPSLPQAVGNCDPVWVELKKPPVCLHLQRALPKTALTTGTQIQEKRVLR